MHNNDSFEKRYVVVVYCFKESPFYNYHIEKLKIKRLKTLICFSNFFFMKN